MTKAEFAAELARLRAAFSGELDNPLSYRCEDCTACVSCMFCVGCEDCYRCTHSSGCRGCTQSSHCRDCVSCHDCSHCVESEACRSSQYLVRCYSCSDSLYCYGCVGLAKKEFHILNVPYSRKEYFALIKELEGSPGSRRPEAPNASSSSTSP
jgi:hypothetical protein